VGKVYNLYRVKTDISAVLTVKNGLDTHMIIELKDDLNRCSLFMLLLSRRYVSQSSTCEQDNCSEFQDDFKEY
jgi:hypothetical protein